MLYVFHVDAGLMTTYDMKLTLQSVSSLKAAIERKTKIPAHSLVLLVSGGEVLQSDHLVSSYSAGTDTNPIYMFSKPSVKDGSLRQSTQYSVCDLSPIVELSTEQWRSESRSGVEGKSVAELTQAVELSYTLPPTVPTVVSCAALAQQFSEQAHDLARCCDQLVHDQHLQHQGWSAVVANLEDIFNEFCERSKNFKESFKKHRLRTDHYHEQLDALNEVLESLDKIPILPALQMNAEAHRFSGFDFFEDEAMQFEAQYDRIAAPLDNSGERSSRDFGVDAFKMSQEDVFEAQKQSMTEAEQDSSDPNQTLEESDENVNFKAQSYENKQPTLLRWILAQGNKRSLQDLLDYCQKGLTLIDADPLKEREAELCQILEYANMHGLKQIKGIEDRLYRLDHLLSEVKKLERDQHDQAQSLIQNRERVSNTACDPSVLPTLVQSHRCQLEKLLKNHQVLVDIRRRIAKSKDELSQVLKARLEAVLMIENSMSVQDAHQMLSFQCFNRLARYFDIVGQLHRAPDLFAHAVTEVARRRTFSDAFLQWATDLTTNLLKIHEEEVTRRQEFNNKFHGHFLKSLFPGMAELPPPYATQAPPVFDSGIPQLTDDDVTFVAGSFPDLVKDVPRYDMETTVKFFRQRFSSVAYEDKDVEVQADLEKGFDSETETGDFERLSRQSTTDRQRVDISTTCVPETMAVSTVTENRLQIIPEEAIGEEFINSEIYIEDSLPSSLEWGRDDKDNMDTHKINIEKLKDFLVKVFEVCKVNVIFIREELAKLKYEIEEQKKFISEKYLEVLQAWQRNNEENAISFREQTQRLTVDHELELSDLKNDLNRKDEVIDSLKTEKENLKSEHQNEMQRLVKDHDSTKEVLEKTQEEIRNFEKKLEELEIQKQKEIKELQEKMHMDYKAEIESLRSRFRLVALTNMDRSPSESSLEKIERTDVIEISSHNAIVMQTKENAEIEKEEAVREAKESCEKQWRQKMEEELNTIKEKYEAEKQVTINDVTRRLLSEKDRQLEILREREMNLVRECVKYKETIEQLTDPETNDYDGHLKSQLATLETENATLKKQLEELKKESEKKAEEAEKSKEDDSESRSGPSSKKSSVSSRVGHTPVGLSGGALSLSACGPGLCVLVLWEPHHHHYTVLQESPIMYFVHSDCLSALELSVSVKNENERKLYAVGIVESKEYCYAKKSGNRYHMPRGSRFYRVRVKPYKQLPAPSCCDHKHKTDVLKVGALAVLCDQRPVKKWLTYMHAPDSSRPVDSSQSTSSTTDEANRIAEVATATLINLESPVSSDKTAGPSETEKTVGESEVPVSNPEEQLDSIETGDWSSRMQISSVSAVTDMECSVGRVLGPELDLPTELTVSALEVQTRASTVPPEDSELAEEATP